MNDKPNLFHFATSELSQDAFLCWLLSWADSKCAKKDRSLHQTAVEFVRSIMEKCDKSVSEQSFNIEKVHRQYKSIDVLALLGQGNERYALSIEDKTDTSIHGDQLSRYKKIVVNDFPDYAHLFVYLKTGEISQEMEAKKAGYHVYSRKEFLAVLRKGKDKTGNAIFRDFYEYLEAKNDRYETFRTKKVDDWVQERDAWKGFFNELQKRMPRKKLEWDYAPNPAAGELVCFWGYTEYKDYDVYLAIHKKCEDRGRYFLAFKVDNVPKEKRAEIRQNLHDRLIGSARNHGWGDVVCRPPRFGNGNSMIFAQTKEDSSDRWLAKDAEGKLDMDTTLKNLEKAKRILHKAI